MNAVRRITGLNSHNSSDDLRLGDIVGPVPSPRAFFNGLLSVIACLALLADFAAPNAAETALTKPAPAAGSIDPATSMLKFRVAPGFKVDLFAAEPLVQNIVSFAFD